METHNDQGILNETGGDYSFADLFIQSAKEKAAEYACQIPQSIIDDFSTEVEKHRKNWEKR